MSEDMVARVRGLNRREIIDLMQAGLVLAFTIGLALVVPPHVLAGDAPEHAPVKMESGR
jgi:hypothetical protein